MDLDFDTLDTFSADALAEHMTRCIKTGKYAAGLRLPSVRALAKRLGVAPGTVAKAYARLQDEGFLAAERGRGTFVLSRWSLAARTEGGGSPIATSFLGHHPRAALVARWLANTMVTDGIQLMGGYGDPKKPLARGFTASLEEHDTANDITRLYMADGAPQALSQVAARFSQLMQAPVAENSIIFGQGANLLLDTTLRAITRPGDVIMAEDPTYYGALDLFEAYGLEVVPISRTAAGLDLDELDRVCARERSRLLYFTGSPSNPFGLVMDDREEGMFRDIVRRRGLTVIEDSSLWPFQYSEPWRRPLFATDVGNQVILICSLSKWLFPSLRLAVAIGTSRNFGRVRLVHRGMMRISSCFPQLPFATYISSQSFERDLQSACALYREARDVAASALELHLPDDVGVTLPGGGFTIWLNLPPTISADRLYAECLRFGVYPLPGHIFSFDRREADGLRLAFGQNDAAQLAEAISRLGKAMQAARIVTTSKTFGFGAVVA